jgi:hypothetical protein
MSDSSGKILVAVRPSVFASWFHHLLTRPFVEIDGVEYPVAWGTRTLDVAPGGHRISVYFRYRGQRSVRLGEGRAALAAADRLRVRAQLGVLNSSRFRITGPGVTMLSERG